MALSKLSQEDYKVKKSWQRRAAQIVFKAVANKSISRPTSCICVDCGATASHYDHRDYSRPVEVDPVCHGCNLRRGTAKYPDIFVKAPYRKCVDQKTTEFNRQQKEVARPRAERAIRLREAGETWATIGRILGVSRQRAQQLAKAHSK